MRGVETNRKQTSMRKRSSVLGKEFRRSLRFHLALCLSLHTTEFKLSLHTCIFAYTFC